MPYKLGQREIYGLGERGSGYKPRSINGYQDYKKIVAKCLEKGLIFEDDEFPPNDESIGPTDDGGPYIWKRPHEIAKNLKPEFVVGGADRFDVKQGDLGNCWLLAAVAAMTLNQEMFEFVCPADNAFGDGKYTGAFHFRFWQFGKWIEVVIDDRLPCHPDGELAFMHSDTKNEFWSPLFEKAYAKMNGSYTCLDGGLTFEALEDFTGGFTEVFMMDRLKSMKLIQGPDDFFRLLQKSFERNTFMGTSVKEVPGVTEAELENGLVCGHAYTITDLKVLKVKMKDQMKLVRLIRLRNPWGSEFEWKGNWCDGSPTWKMVSEEQKQDLQLNFGADGEFWMSYRDFMANFERVEVCHTNPYSDEEILRGGKENKGWVSQSITGNWTKGVTAGGSRKHKDTFADNAQYILTVGNPGDGEKNTVIICLLKEWLLMLDVPDVEDLSFTVYPLTEGAPVPLTKDYLFDKANPPLEQVPPLKGIREVTIRYHLDSGNYIIIPSSLKPNQEGNFLLRVFTEGPSSLKLYDRAVTIKEVEAEVRSHSPEEKARMEWAKEFFKMVAGSDEEVNWWDLKLILDKSFHDEFKFEGFGFSEDVCRSMIALLDEDRSGKLSFFEFTNLWTQVVAWKKIFSDYDKDDSFSLGSLKTNELRAALRAGGYEVNKDILEAIVLRYGDRNSEICLDKFIIAALKLKTMMELYKRRVVGDEARIKMDDWLSETIYS